MYKHLQGTLHKLDLTTVFSNLTSQHNEKQKETFSFPIL